MEDKLEKSIEREICIRNLFNQDKCILEIAQDHHVYLCHNYGTEICKNSKYKDICNYRLERE